MSRVVDLDDERNVFCGCDGECEKWNIDPDAIEERKTGTWNRYYRMHSGDTFVCNRCGSCFVVLQGEDKMNFCPNCGSCNEG